MKTFILALLAAFTLTIAVPITDADAKPRRGYSCGPGVGPC